MVFVLTGSKVKSELLVSTFKQKWPRSPKSAQKHLILNTGQLDRHTSAEEDGVIQYNLSNTIQKSYLWTLCRDRFISHQSVNVGAY